MSYTASAVTGQVPKFQKLLEWPEPKLSRVRLIAVCYTVQPGMKSPGSLGEVPMMSLFQRLD